MGAATKAPEERSRIGTTIAGRYRVIEQLGIGGMGTVYRAGDLTAGHEVALKILRPHLSANEEATARFHREASVGGKVLHPNCVGVTAVGSCDDGAIYLAMELLDGRSLGDVLADGPLPWRRALHIARHVLRGLHHAHEQGIVHRDIKPDNILLCRGADGDPDLARLLDFGIAKLVGESGGAAITQAGLTIGTPEYLSPEQASAGTLDGRSDLYSLSAVLFEMITGRTPFHDADLMKILIAHTSKPVPAIAEVAPAIAVPPEVEQLIRDGLAKLPRDRIANAAAYIARIDALLAPAPTALDTVPDGAIGTILEGRYRLEAQIGHGGMGRVYRATHLGLGRAVAVKILDAPHIDDTEAARRFEREAQSAGRLRHRNCVSVTDFGAASDGRRYLVMELAEGVNLADVLAQHPRLPAARAVHVARHVLRGLAHAHAHGLVHRDLKPANVMLVHDGEDLDVARILDFGLARMVAGDDRITRTGIACGTPRYMAPEQALDRGVDARCDLYALSVILFEMLAGRTPFDHPESAGLLRLHMSAPVPRIAEVAPGVVVPPGLEEVMRRGLAKRSEDRPQSADEYLRLLDAAIQPADQTIELSAFDPAVSILEPPAPRPAAAPAVTPTSIAPPPPLPRTGSPRFTRRQLAIAGACGGVLLVGIIAAIATGAGEKSRAPAAAPAAAAKPADAEIEMDAESPPSVGADVAKALQLANAGRAEDAVAKLRELRKRRPDAAEIPYALGRVYKRLDWPKQTIEAYRDAIELDPAYREDPALIADLVALLASRSAWQLASRTLENDIGTAAIPALAEAAERHSDATVRSRAAKLRDRL